MDPAKKSFFVFVFMVQFQTISFIPFDALLEEYVTYIHLTGSREKI